MICHYIWLFSSIAACSFPHAESANILAILPINGPSHFIIFEKILTGLAERGHNVDVVSHFSLRKPVPGYNEIRLANPGMPLRSSVSMSLVHGMSLYGILSVILSTSGLPFCQRALEDPALHTLRNGTKRYDLLVHHLLSSDCTLGFAHALDIPAVVSIITSVDLPWGGSRLDNPAHPAYVPTYFSNFAAPMTLPQRLLNVLNLLTSWIAYDRMSIQPTNKMLRDFFGPDIPTLNELMKKTSLILVNSHFSMNQARPTVPNFVEVGGLHIGVPEPVPQKLEEIIQNNKHGFIYMTMGSMLMSETFSIEKLQGLFDAFSELPQTVLWKANKTQFPKGLKFPENVHFETWMPQLDLLCHPKIKLFITHGGLLSSQEAVYCGVPRIAIPIYADQELNAAQSVQTQTTLRVSYGNITKHSILEAAKEILYNEKYAINAKKLSELFKDRPISPLETAIYWMEYVIRYKGAPHLRTIGADMPWYQYYLVDVALVFLLAISVLTYVIYLVIRKAVLLVIGKNVVKIKSN